MAEAVPEGGAVGASEIEPGWRQRSWERSRGIRGEAAETGGPINSVIIALWIAKVSSSPRISNEMPI